MLYDDLSIAENLRFYGRMHNIPDPARRIHKLIAKVGLTERRNDAVRTLSRGMQQRLAIARAILHRPRIVLLDEPYTGLDQHASEALSSLLQELLAEGHTVVMTTNDLQRGIGISDQVVILVAGQLVHKTDASELSISSLRRIYRQCAEIR
jgi:heme exporter protein A